MSRPIASVRRHLQQIGERAIQTQHAIVRVVHHDQIRNGVEILAPIAFAIARSAKTAAHSQAPPTRAPRAHRAIAARYRIARANPPGTARPAVRLRSPSTAREPRHANRAHRPVRGPATSSQILIADLPPGPSPAPPTQCGQPVLNGRVPPMRRPAEPRDRPLRIPCHRQHRRSRSQDLCRAGGQSSREFRRAQGRVQFQSGCGELRQQALERAVESGSYFPSSFKCTH